MFVSAKSGLGIEELRATIDRNLPRPAVELRVLLPYDRADLMARIHRSGQVIATRHTDEGTELQVRVDEQLAAELATFRD